MAAQKSAITIGLPSGGLLPDVRRRSAGLIVRRETLLATSALALGLALSVAGPDHALADCAVTSAPNTVTCSASTTAANNVADDWAGMTAVRALRFNIGGNVNASIQGGVTIDGAGMAIVSTQAGAAVTVTHDGIVDQTGLGTLGGLGALRVQAAGGLLTYSGNGSVTTNQAATSAVVLQNTSGDIVVGSVGTPVMPNYSGASGLVASAVDGNVHIFLSGGTITTPGEGVSGSSTGAGNVAITLAGGTALTGAGAAGVTGGSTGTGNVTISSDASIGTAGARFSNGIVGATTSAGPVTLTQTGGAIFVSSNGISAQNLGAGGVVVDQQAGTIDSSSYGISAQVTGASGGVTATIGGGLTASSVGVNAFISNAANADDVAVTANAATVGNNFGVAASHSGTGSVTVNGTGLIRGANVVGIRASHSGTGPGAGTGILVGGSGDVTAAIGGGIEALITNVANASDILVERTGTVTVTAGIRAGVTASSTGTGHVTVRNAAGVTSFGGTGIRATSGGGNVAVTDNGAVQGGTIGIEAVTTGTGLINISTGGSVTALAGHGITASGGTGSVNISVAHAVSATGGDGVRATGSGVLEVNNTTSITSTGAFAGMSVIGGTSNVVTNGAGALISGDVGVVVQSSVGGNTFIDSRGTITGTSGVAVHFTGGTGNILLMNDSGARLVGMAIGNGTDRLQLGGSAANAFDVSQIGAGFATFEKIGASTWTLTGTATTTAATTVSAGTLLVNGNTATSATTVSAGATLGGNGTVGNTTIDGGTLSPGNSIGTLTVQGNLVFTSAAAYLVEVSPASADRTTVSGTATLAGTVTLQFAPGAYLTRSYTILSAAGGRTGTFSGGVASPAGFEAALSYTPTDVILSLTAGLGGIGTSGLNQNQQNVATAINGHFNNGGSLPPAFVSLFGLTGQNLANTLSQLSGQVGAGAPQAAFQSIQSFLNLMLDPFVSGRGGGVGGAPLGFAPDHAQAAMPDEVALAYAQAMPVKAPIVAYEPMWSVWASAYGGAAKTDGNAAIGASSTDSRTGGFAAGADYRLGRDTVVGFALAGGGTSWSVANGGGRSDTFQAGLYGSHRFGAAYLSAALAYAWHDTTTTRTVSIGPETLQGRFEPHVLAGRAEAGYRFGWASYGLTPYAAAQVMSFDAPGYAETATAGAGTFALSYAGQTQTATRTELGLWADHRAPVTADTELLLRGRAAWAHDYNTDRRITPTFLALPGASFTVNGSSSSPDLALISAVAELRMRGGVSLSAKFDGEFGSRSESYAATGTLRYAW